MTERAEARQAESAVRMPTLEAWVLETLRMQALVRATPYRFGATSDLAAGVYGTVTVAVVRHDGSTLTPRECEDVRRTADEIVGRRCVQVVTGSRAEALDPETTAERLALLALVFADEVRANPAMVIYRLTRPDLFADLSA
jgi:hypothetical protein